MKNSIKIEEIGMLLLGIFLFSKLCVSVWWFLGLFLMPDVSMLGYAINTKVGAILYNIFHHKAIALLLYFAGMMLQSEVLQFIGILLFSHSCFDRILGYGLKYKDSFNNTHLGKIGKHE